MYACNVCEWYGESFLPAGKPLRDSSSCPDCFSKERHRLSYLFMDELLDDMQDIGQVLHVAPEKDHTNYKPHKKRENR